MAKSAREFRIILFIYCGTLFGILTSSLLSPPLDGYVLHLIEVAIIASAFTGLGLGFRAYEESQRAKPLHLLIGLPVGFLTFGISALYAIGLSHLLEGDPVEGQDITITATLILQSIILAPLLEEALCRGALWEAMRRVSSEKTTILGTAALFALMHGLEAYVLSLPHRFLAGIAFGLLRLKTGSLWPAVLAHAMHNALAVFLLTP